MTSNPEEFMCTDFMCQAAEFNGSQCRVQCSSCKPSRRNESVLTTIEKARRSLDRLAEDCRASGMRGYARRLRIVINRLGRAL